MDSIKFVVVLLFLFLLLSCKKVSDKVEEKVNHKIDETIDNTLNKIDSSINEVNLDTLIQQLEKVDSTNKKKKRKIK